MPNDRACRQDPHAALDANPEPGCSALLKSGRAHLCTGCSALSSGSGGGAGLPSAVRPLAHSLRHHVGRRSAPHQPAGTRDGPWRTARRGCSLDTAAPGAHARVPTPRIYQPLPVAEAYRAGVNPMLGVPDARWRFVNSDIACLDLMLCLDPRRLFVGRTAQPTLAMSGCEGSGQPCCSSRKQGIVLKALKAWKEHRGLSVPFLHCGLTCPRIPSCEAPIAVCCEGPPPLSERITMPRLKFMLGITDWSQG